MQLRLFKTLWGHDGTVEDAARLAVEAGFDGLEGPVPADTRARERLAHALIDADLAFICEICTAGSYVPRRQATPAEHLADLEAAILRAQPLAPQFCNVIAGCDAWPLDQQVDFFGRADQIAARHGVTCSFETHRSRSFFNPWITRDVLRQLPALRITCDFSHWVVVCERLLDSEWDVIERIAPHAHHVHGRIGYDQGPQVPHPAAPEYAQALASHERCWRTLWAEQMRRGCSMTTLTPEFGPDGYLHCLPFTGAPVADLWEINRWIGVRERAQFAEWIAGQPRRGSGAA